MNSHDTDLPDRSYWTAYDLRMAERDARAAQSARIHLAIARTCTRLWQHITKRAPKPSMEASQ